MSDYLWDGAGQPDRDVERLEAALRPLRYAPPAEPFVLPEAVDARIPGKSRVIGWALAASVAFCALALGLWFMLHSRPDPMAVAEVGTSTGSDLIWSDPGSVAVGDDPGEEVAPPVATPRLTVRRVRPEQISSRTRSEQREGRLAAEQLMKALRITSDQLNYVRTRAAQTGGQTPDS